MIMFKVRYCKVYVMWALVSCFAFSVAWATVLPGEMKRVTGEVKRVIDGDTLLLSSGTKIRLIGVDTPEVHESAKLVRDANRSGKDKRTIKMLGKKSSQFVKQLMTDAKIMFEYDVANTRSNHLDKYGRTLAYVYFDMSRPPTEYIRYLQSRNETFKKGQVMLNALLIQCGYANVYTRFPYVHMESFRQYERSARDIEVGLWAESEGLQPANEESQTPRSELSELALIASRNSKVYHKAGCRDASKISLNNLMGFGSQDEAKASGRNPCLRCGAAS